MKIFSYITIAVCSLLCTYSCTTPLQAVATHPAYFNGKTVIVKGKVVNTLHLDDLSFFTIKGGQHKVNVVTNDFLPVVGDIVKVKGTVIAKFYYQRDTIAVVKEIVRPSKRETNQFNKSVN